MKATVLAITLAIVSTLVALALAVFIGIDRWQDDDDAAQPEPQATATGWSAAECDQARTTLDGLQTSIGWCRLDSADACVELQMAIAENCP